MRREKKEKNVIIMAHPSLQKKFIKEILCTSLSFLRQSALLGVVQSFIFIWIICQLFLGIHKII